jgi:hypothetical protein
MKGLTKSEEKIFKNLNTPQKIQDYLDKMPINHEKSGETLMSPRKVIDKQKAHCIEAALFGATALWFHGRKPLLLDLKTIGPPQDYDHVVALFKERGYWGAISKTNHAMLRYRDPIYKTVRELALSFFHEYFIESGKKTLRSYSKPFDLSKLGDSWVTSKENLWNIEKKLDQSPHTHFFPSLTIKHLRKASAFEVKVLKPTEWAKR